MREGTTPLPASRFKATYSQNELGARVQTNSACQAIDAGPMEHGLSGKGDNVPGSIISHEYKLTQLARQLTQDPWSMGCQGRGITCQEV